MLESFGHLREDGGQLGADEEVSLEKKLSEWRSTMIGLLRGNQSRLGGVSSISSDKLTRGWLLLLFGRSLFALGFTQLAGDYWQFSERLLDKSKDGEQRRVRVAVGAENPES